MPTKCFIEWIYDKHLIELNNYKRIYFNHLKHHLSGLFHLLWFKFGKNLNSQIKRIVHFNDTFPMRLFVDWNYCIEFV